MPPNDRFDHNEPAYRPPETRDLVAEYFREPVASVPLSFEDDEAKPTVSIRAAQDTVTEGESLDLTLTLTPPGVPFSGREHFDADYRVKTPIRVKVTDSATNAEEEFEVLFYPSNVYYDGYRRGDTMKTVQYRVPDTMDDSRQLTFTVEESPTDSYHDGNSVTVPVGAALPGAPQNLSAAIGDGRVTLCWDPPVSRRRTADPAVPVHVARNRCRWCRVRGPHRCSGRSRRRHGCGQ